MRDRLELEEQARFADPRLTHRGDDLSMPLAREFQRVLHLLQLGLTAHELRQSALCGHLKPRAQRTQAVYFEDVDRFADAFDRGWPQRLEAKISFAQLLRVLSRSDRADRR